MRRIRLLYGLLLLANAVNSQVYQPELARYSIASGLSQSTVTDITQDGQGFLWVGTQDGLNRFDGYQFRVYRDTEKSRVQLPSDYITRIVPAENGDLWIGTQQGLARYQSDIDQVSSLELLELNDRIHDLIIDGNDLWIGSASGLFILSHDQILRQVDVLQGEKQDDFEVFEMVLDDRNHLWLATNQGVFCIDRITFKVHQLDANTDIPWSKDIRSIAYISKRIWLGTNKGLWSVHLPDSIPDSNVIFPKKFESYLSGTDRYPGQSGILNIFQDSQKRIWVGTESNGLMYLDRNSDQIVPYTASYMYDEEFFATTSIHRIFQDMYENLWIGTLEQGIYKISFSSKKFGLMRVNGRGGTRLSNNRVRGMMEQGDFLWVGTAQGLNRLNRVTQSNMVLTHQPLDEETLSSNDVKYMLTGPDQHIWVATNNGLNKLDPISMKVRRYNANDSAGKLIFHNKVRGMRIIDEKELWVGTLGGGVTVIDPINNKLLKRFDVNDSSGLTNNNVMYIFQDSSSEIWVTSYGGGLMKFNRDLGKFQTVVLSEDMRIGKLLSSINEDQYGQLWVGSYGDGVFKVDRKSLEVQVYNTVNGMSSDVVYGVIPVRDEVWMSTNQGINKLNLKNGQFSVFQQSDGLQSDEFNTGSFFKARDGELFFGGTNGLSFFYPDSIVEETIPPRVAFTDFKIFNESVVPGQLVGKGDIPPLPTALKDAASLVLHHEHNVFTFEFAALDFRNSNDIRFSYLLEGFDKNWISTNSQSRTATYTNLSPGRYTFFVKATNGDRMSGDSPITLNIRVLPAYWQTWWFRLTVAASILLLLSYLVYRRISKAERRKVYLEKEVEKHTRVISSQKQLVEQKNARLKKLALRKDQLFFLLTHNMRGPLTSLSGLLNLLSPQNKVIQEADFEAYSEEIKHQVDDSLLLLDNTFYYSYTQFEELHPKIESVNFHQIIGRICDRFGAKAHHKNITLDWSKKVDDQVLCDPKLTSLVLENLMSNAVKFAYSDSLILLSSERDQDKLIFSIENEGIELSEEIKAVIFDGDKENIAFGTGKERGAGIGLSICNKLTQLMGQELSVETNEAKTKFILRLPVR
ncbi:MAG: two-component regulator propeller domain-containing protein [Cytophagales bacterium]|nr:two-component regulator propeller domain-containing protein [Cytophagales bacterium]